MAVRPASRGLGRPYRPHRPAPPPSPAEARRLWGEALAWARAAADAAARGEVMTATERALLAGSIVRLKGCEFPLRFASATAAAAAFGALARTFVEAGHPPALAGFLAAGAECLAAMLEADKRAAFDRSCRVVGED
ncbi:MAG: hypothetical protein ACOY5Y_07110 [Pseudomonadota bacterium]